MKNLNPPCGLCHGPHPFDTCLESAVWNDVVKRAGLPDYLCLTCIVDTFAKAERSFTASLVSEEHNLVHVEFRFNGKKPDDLAAVAQQNLEIRQGLAEIGTVAFALRDSMCRPKIA